MPCKRAFIIFPNQLFNDVKAIKEARCNHIFVVEEPIYFYDAAYKPIKPHKIKVAYLRACMKAYHELHLKKLSKMCTYIDYASCDTNYSFIDKDFDEVVLYNPVDNELMKKLENISKNKNIKLDILETPDLLLPISTLNTYYTKHKTPKHASFYEFVKTNLSILKNTKNLDKMNRSSPPLTEPNVYTFKPKATLTKYYDEAIKYTKQNFHEHIGECENVKAYPITFTDTKRAFEAFLTTRLENFGKYEDAIMEKDAFMYHSVMSPMMNIGLILPKQIIDMVVKKYEQDKDKIPLSSFEGFVRQVIGWRCFMQSIYIFKSNEIELSNSPNNFKTFKNYNVWYKGETGIYPFDCEVKKTLQYGYSHHIVRLMIFMNLFILCEVHPHEIYKWFMEVVSIDAYSWVMISNIYAMGYFYPNIMSKPYISSSNYITKMSNYKKDGKWNVIWDALYHDFLRTKPSSYSFFYKRTYKNNPEFHKFAIDFKSKHFVDYVKK